MKTYREQRVSPAANIATTVAKAMAERGDDVGPNVTLVLLAELEANQVLLASRDQRIRGLEEGMVWAKRAARVIEDLEGPTRDWDYDESMALMDWPEAMDDRD